MNKIIENLWAKKRSDENGQFWLPLLIHLKDTKNVINFLYNHWISEGQKEILISDFDSEEDLQKFIKFIGFVHDIGKATPAFQTKKSYNCDKDLDDILIEKIIREGVEGISELKLSDANKSPHNIAGEALLEEFGCSEYIGAIIGGHHGKTTDDRQDLNIRYYTKNYRQDEKRKGSKNYNIWLKIQMKLFELALREAGYEKKEELPNVIEQPQAVLLEGLLIMADWLASSETIQEDDGEIYPLFPLVDINVTYEDIDSDERFRNAINIWYREEVWNPENYYKIEDVYKKRWGYVPYDVQKIMSEAIEKSKHPNLVIIENTMGGGKTETALVAAEQLARKNKRNGVFWGLPTQVTANAMFSRVNSWLENISKEKQENFSIDLLHGKAKFNEEYRNLPQASEIMDEEESDGAVTVNSWFSGKKSILTKFTVGTIDNLLLMGLKQKHLFLRHFGFADKVVILDEVHAYDTYMSSYFFKALEWLGAYKVPVVILSATLPVEKREKIVRSYTNNEIEEKNVVPNKWQKNKNYPLLTIVDKGEIKQIDKFKKEKGYDIEVKRINIEDDAIIEKVIDDINTGGIAGIIVNTVKRAQKLAQLVPDDIPSIVLHSSFLAPERVRLEKELQKKIGKNGERPEKLVVIGTQVLEQSLDIDFDILYSDIAPIDLLLQRAGRLHRHKINNKYRPDKLIIPQLIVMENIDGDSNEYIYSKYILMKTDYFLSDRINIPNDISPLVQKVYSLETDKLVPNFDESKKEFEEMNKKSIGRAEVFQINEPDFDASIHSWLSRSINLSNDSELRYEQKAKAAVRDISETIEVILLKKMSEEGEYRLVENNKRIEEVDSEEIAKQTLRLPEMITNYGIEKIIATLEGETPSSWQKDPWLKNEISLILDKENEASLNGWNLKYSKKYGLLKERKDSNE